MKFGQFIGNLSCFNNNILFNAFALTVKHRGNMYFVPKSFRKTHNWFAYLSSLAHASLTWSSIFRSIVYRIVQVNLKANSFVLLYTILQVSASGREFFWKLLEVMCV